jgi:hypothetical protein
MTGYAYKRATGDGLWQWSFYDRVIRREEDVSALARYIVENPRRAGLTQDGERWPFAGGALVEEAPALVPAPSGAKVPPLRAT